MAGFYTFGNDRRTVITIVLTYLTVGTLWIFLSDSLLWFITDTHDLLTELSIAKGLLFVVITSLLLYKLIHLLVIRNIEATERLRTDALVLESMAEGVSVCNQDGIIIFTNPAFDEMFGYDRGSLIGRHVTILNNNSPEENRKIFQQVTEQLMATGKWSGEFQNRKKDGTTFFTYARISPLERTPGASWVTVQEDITDRKMMEQMKDEIVSAVSHEMRTPLTAIMGFIQLMQEAKTPPAQFDDYLRTMHKETERLNDLIGNFLDMQRIKAKQGGYRFTPLSVLPLLEEVVGLYSRQTDRHLISVDASGDIPQVIADRESLKQSLAKLLSNAIKYSARGGNIVIGARFEGAAVVIWVRDEGIGIPPEALDKVFDRFYRVDNTDRRATGGTGLGLALVRETIQAHGGRVWAESVVGKGSTFFISLPAVTVPGGGS